MGLQNGIMFYGATRQKLIFLEMTPEDMCDAQEDRKARRRMYNGLGLFFLGWRWSNTSHI